MTVPIVSRACVLRCAVLFLVAGRAGPADELSLTEAQQLAQANQPLLTGQRAAVRAAQDAAIAARQLPDPKLQFGVLNMPVTGPDAFSRRRMTHLKPSHVDLVVRALPEPVRDLLQSKRVYLARGFIRHHVAREQGKSRHRSVWPGLWRCE